MFKKTNLWRGALYLVTAVTVFAMTVGQVLEVNQNMVNSYLGTRTYITESSSNGSLYTAFTSDYASTDELVAAHIALGSRIGEEGSVLLKNNGALPIASDAGVTLLGLGADAKTVYGARVGVAVLSGQNVSLTAALTELGVKVNPTMNEVYSALASGKYKKALSKNANKLQSSFVGVLPGEEKAYEMLEPTIADLKEQDPKFLESFAAYGDAAIVVFSRSSTEGADYFPGTTGVDQKTGARNPLALSNDERAVLELAKENFDRVIVLLNSNNPMEVGELEADEQIDAVLWIGIPGNYGMRGVAAVLTGAANPSGATTDIYASDSTSSPAMANFGLCAFANAAQYLDTAVDRGDYYVIEAEGIYTGYRYYETRYADAVMGQGNASSSAGTFDSRDGWSYADEVTYGFGYGLSYTTFDRRLDSVTADVQAKTITAQITVTNTGSTAGKTSVQLYGQAPYIAGGVEKSAVELLGFEKTEILQPGASQTVTITADLEFISSYDSSIGKYILDGGDYWFSTGNGAHEALNNMLAAQGYTAADGMTSDGDSANAQKWAYAPDGGVDTKTFAVTEAGAEVRNQLDEADFNTWQPGTVTYLSRSDWEGTWPRTYAGLSISENMLPYLKNDFYTVATGDDTSAFTFGADNGLTFAGMKGVAYDDPMWDQLIDQMTLQEQVIFITKGNMVYAPVDSIGFTGGTLAQDAPNGFKEKLNAYSDENSPWFVSEDDPNASYYTGVFGSTTLIGASFNKQLAEDLGTLIGNVGLYDGLCINWGTGLNLHRSPYNGRNCEYYSEDPILAGLMASAEAKGAISKGLITAVKHFAFNDQETNRNGVGAYMNEQKARELELRAFQIAFENGCLGTMTAFNRIGTTYVSASKGLISGILQGEWGFHGYVVTDMVNPASYMTWKESVIAGTTNFDTVDVQPEWAAYITADSNTLSGDAAMLTAMRKSVHDSLYAFAQTNLMNAVDTTTHRVEINNWWRWCYKSVHHGCGGLAVLCLIGYAAAKFGSKRKEKKA